jgi:hypothetical protein
MSTLFVTYLWHYILARGIYDELLHPLAHGDASVLIVLALLVVGAFAAGRRSAPRSRR